MVLEKSIEGSRSKCYVRKSAVLELSLLLIDSLLSQETVFRVEPSNTNPLFPSSSIARTIPAGFPAPDCPSITNDSQCYISPVLSTCPLYTNSGYGKRETHINWPMVMRRQQVLELP